MQRKIFIGINLDTGVKRAVSRALRPWVDLPIKWHKEDSFHIDLITAGWIGEQDFLHIESVMADLSEKISSFTIHFSEITARSKDITATAPEDAQMVQLVGEESDALKELYYAIGKGLNVPHDHKKNFRPIVTLGRMRAKKWQELAQYPFMHIPLTMPMDVTTLTLFESVRTQDAWQLEPVAVYELQ